ncbi:hypothetical protein, partial [Pseudoalteromonas sp. SYSU M81241]
MTPTNLEQRATPEAAVVDQANHSTPGRDGVPGSEQTVESGPPGRSSDTSSIPDPTRSLSM